jgi:transposase
LSYTEIGCQFLTPTDNYARTHSRFAQPLSIQRAIERDSGLPHPFGGEEPSQVMADLDIHNSYTLRNWVSLYQQKIQTGLITLPAMKRTQQQDIAALKQRNAELEQALQQANLLILALNTMIEVAEKELKVPIRKKSGRSGAPPKRS